MRLSPKEKEFERQVLASRCTAVLVMGSLAYCFAGRADEHLAQFWQWLQSKWMFRHESFEPLLSVFCFLVFIGFWRAVDEYCPSLWKYRIHPSNSMRAWHYGDRFTEETLWYLLPLVVFDIYMPRRKLPELPPSLFVLILQVTAAIALYDALFWAWHFTLHRHPSLYRTIHAKHHMMPVQRACEAVRHSLLDGAFDVACSILALNIISCHPLSRMVYNITLIWLITELHAGYDFPWQLHNLLPLGVLGGPRQHDLHHQVGNKHFQKFGSCMQLLEKYLS